MDWWKDIYAALSGGNDDGEQGTTELQDNNMLIIGTVLFCSVFLIGILLLSSRKQEGGIFRNMPQMNMPQMNMQQVF